MAVAARAGFIVAVKGDDLVKVRLALIDLCLDGHGFDSGLVLRNICGYLHSRKNPHGNESNYVEPKKRFFNFAIHLGRLRFSYLTYPS